MNEFVTSILLAVLVEALVEYVKTIIAMVESKEYKTFATQMAAIAVGILLAFAAGANFFAEFGLFDAYPVVGVVLTGIVASRGTRLCLGLLDGADKLKFYIFDFCGNFEFFRMNAGKPTANMVALQCAVFNLKAQIAFKLQDIAYQTTDLIGFRKSFVDDMVRKVQELSCDNFAVKQHLKYVDLYSDAQNYDALTYENTLQIREELAPLIQPDDDEASAVRFDALMYGIELAYLVGKKYARARSNLFKRVSAVASVANIPEIMVQAELINKILQTDYLENAGINEFEHIRENLRGLMKYIPKGPDIQYTTHFDDELLSTEWRESELENDDLKNYKPRRSFTFASIRITLSSIS